MRTIFFLSLIYLPVNRLLAQLHYPDEWWPIGTTELVGAPGDGNAWLHFHDDTVTIVPADLSMNFESTVAVASDTTGQVLFYSNGCEIRNANGNLLENGEGLHPGELHDWVCANGYTVPRGMMALPWPGHSSRWILLHTGGNYDPVRKLTYGPFYYTEIDMSLNGGQGGVVSKNNVLATGDLEPFAVVRHGNGRDWWVVMPDYSTNQYQLWLLTPNGMQLFVTQQIGPAIGCRRVGASVFSPDGSKYARTNNCAAVVLDFDRCNGQFSNPVFLERSVGTVGGGGLVFSNNNRWLYATSNLSIFRADLQSSTSLLDSLFKQPYYEGESQYVYGTSLAYMQLAPDGKIYMNARHREQYFSSIDIEADTFYFKPVGLSLPVATVRTLPYFPDFRLYDLSGSACDTLGINGATSATFTTFVSNVFDISPNPFSNWLQVSLKGNFRNPVFCLYDQLGNLAMKNQLAIGITDMETSSLPPGFYIWEVTANGERIKSGKCIKLAE